MEIYVRRLLYGIGGIASGLYMFYVFFKYKKISFDKLKDLPETRKERIIKLRVEKYGWIAIVSGFGCVIGGIVALFNAF